MLVKCSSQAFLNGHASLTDNKDITRYFIRHFISLGIPDHKIITLHKDDFLVFVEDFGISCNAVTMSLPVH
jgi:hypothetical protein